MEHNLLSLWHCHDYQRCNLTFSAMWHMELLGKSLQPLLLHAHLHYQYSGHRNYLRLQI